ncbi:LysM peptidoglycan-binding domain-containing protein [Defluviitalea raffinosedens]|uniref:LysM peptidoglycan-binding domain-containing protein n=1 Tax=Defluviitalea raffinosedens TaxID=1450156 RepID=A0A7C8LGJ6_9FIRM|nr:LysM peptidoglycan-binding domain-containing protein [Defluviitalea raffinosedens]KAE9633711.1 LysM peptidoglycan-binding domain-containing protein [Defluviitalea raffinosedens]
MYSFYMDGILLPVPPSQFTVKINNKNKTYDLINLGEINVLKMVGLTDIDFEVLLPGVKYPFAVYEGGFKEPSFYLAKFEQLKVNQKPFQFIVSRFSPAGEYLFDTNMQVGMESYTIKESAENGQDILVSIKLKQYKEYATKVLKIVKQNTAIAAAKVETQRLAKEPAKTYTVKAGDTLWAICKKQLGNGDKYKEIAALNGIKNPNLIYPGQVLKLG